MKRRIFGLLMVLTVAASSGVWGEAGDLLSVENKYIKIFINQSPNETGRFAVDVTEGDPGREDDDGKPLIYGHPLPWTSYTTVRIDGTDYVYGKATLKRSGAGLPEGTIVEPPRVVDDKITMTCQFGAVTVEQILDIAVSPTTGAQDTARIRYIVKNNGEQPVEVGLRTAIDTMLGSNDGAPFRLGERQINYDFAVDAGDYPDFWQAFDSFEQPSVIAQGTLKGGGVTPPDRIVFADWGNVADHPWDIPIEPGRPFVRQGEDELDSAIAMYWFPRKLDPGKEYSIVIYYGLGGITFAPGKSFLGITAPAEVQYSGPNSRSYTVVMYMEHQGEVMARDVEVLLELPAGLETVGNPEHFVISELVPGTMIQHVWEIRPTGLYYGDASFRIRVTGEGMEFNEVIRRIRILQPPVLTAKMLVPRLKVEANQWEPNPLTVSFTMQNTDQLTATDVRAELIPGDGLDLAAGEHPERLLADLEFGKEVEISWQLNPVRGFKNGSFKVRVSGSNILPFEVPGAVAIPSLPFTLELAVPKELRPGQVFSVDLTAYNLYDASAFELDIKYNPSQLRLVNVSRGTMLVEDDGTLAVWDGGTNDRNIGLVHAVAGKRSQPFNGEKTTLCRLDWMVIGSGEGVIELPKVKVMNGQGEILPYEWSTVKYLIEGEKK